jgi:hypothetical protein
MSGPKRNPDKLNTIGVVVVGICGAVLVYVTIIALQAFYMNNTSEIQTMADYGGQDKTAKGRRADEMRNINEAGKNAVGPGQEPTFRIPISAAMKLVEEDAKKDPSHLIPALPPSTKPSIDPVFGRPKPVAPPAAPGGAAAPTAAPAGEGSAAATPPAVPMSPTGAPGQPQPVPGAGGVPAGQTPSTGVPTPNPTTGGERKTPANAQPAPGTQVTPNPTTAPAQPKSPTQPASDATKTTKPATQPKTTTAPKATPKTTTPKAPAQPKADPTKGSAAPTP